MKKEEFYELLGDIDESAVEAAGKAPIKQLPFKRIIVSAAAAVCVGLFVAVGILLINNNKPSVTPDLSAVQSTTASTTAATQPTTAQATVAPTDAPTNPPATQEPTEKPTEKQENPDAPIDSGKSENSEVSENSESDNGRERGDSEQAYGDVKIYYVKNGKLYYDTVRMALNPQEIFKVWKQKNNIGSEVELKEYRTENNAWSEEISSGVGYYHVGDTFYLFITVSENLSDYYSRSSEELLTDSLKRTLSKYGNSEYEEVNLILE